MKITKNISLEGLNPNKIYGYHNSNLRLIEERFQAKIVGRGENLMIEGEPEETERLDNLFSTLIDLVRAGNHLGPDDVSLIIELANHPEGANGTPLYVVATTQKTVVKPRTLGQHFYVTSIEHNDIVFAVGPAGTGKTFLAVAMAVAALESGAVDRIILTRPAIEAGENLGYLPGDLKEKIDPYLHPLYDALFDLLPRDKIGRYTSEKVIEVVPLGYMRGRTLNHAFIILDEAQNTTTGQMKMFLTRLGAGSKAVVTGDVTQVDLGDGRQSGLVAIQKILRDIPRIKFIYLDKKDIVRHKLVQNIVAAFEKHGNGEQTRS